MQSPSPAQLARQSLFVALHLVVPGSVVQAIDPPRLPQAPPPLHACACRCAGMLPAPATQIVGHAVPVPGYVHATTAVPLHEPAHIALVAVQAARGGTGAPVTGEQVPSLPGWLHAWH